MNTRSFVALFLLTSLASRALADAPPAPPPAKPAAAVELGGGSTGPTASPVERPWAKGVPPAKQKIAIDLFREGNSLLKESLFVQAAAKYKEALRHWDHPGVHYNLALALLNLDQPVEVFTQLEEALKFGVAPLDTDKFDHAGRYKALIEKQLARVEVVCDHAGAQVSMDGQPLFTAPGRYASLVRVGQHTIVATKTGMVTTQKTPMLPPGQKTVVKLELFSAEDLTHYKRRWSNAMPWSVLGVGIVIAGVGGILHWQSHEQFAQYDAGVVTCAGLSPTRGCVPDPTLQSKRSTAEALQGVAFAAYGIGGATIVAGAVLAYYNRLRPFRVSTPEADKLSLTPLIGPGGGGLQATIKF